MALRGLDISSYQKTLNVRAVDCDFIIVKASQGTKYKNSAFDNQVKQTLESGKLLGLYHYSDGSGWKAEADYFLKIAKPYIGKAILCLDWESTKNANSGGYNPEFLRGNTAYALAFLDRIAEETGSSPFLYTSLSETNYRNYTEIAKRFKLWGACYATSKSTTWQDTPWKEGAVWGAFGTSIAIRQYTGTGRITGYGGNLDMNKAYLTREDWTKLASNSPVEEEKTVSVTFVRRGYSGDLVKALQALLRYRGYDIDVDGLFGPATESAVRDYQSKSKDTSGNPLAVDGIAGPATFASLAKL